jgi:pilus assembly protein Flp/PilA
LKEENTTMTNINDLILRLMVLPGGLEGTLRNRLEGKEEGQGLVEYGLIIALIAVAAVAALGALSGKISGALTTIGNSLS